MVNFPNFNRVRPVRRSYGKLRLGRLPTQQLGKYAEYYAKMEFASCGFEVYTSEVDDHGIDFIVKTKGGPFLEIQVKSIRGLNYIFFPKDKFDLRDNLYAAIVIFMPLEAPQFYSNPFKTLALPKCLIGFEGLCRQEKQTGMGRELIR